MTRAFTYQYSDLLFPPQVRRHLLFPVCCLLDSKKPAEVVTIGRDQNTTKQTFTMRARAISVAVVIVSLSPAAAADAGDDFSNNDLAPYACNQKVRSGAMLTASIQALSASRQVVCEIIHEPVKLLAQVSIPSPVSDIRGNSELAQSSNLRNGAVEHYHRYCHRHSGRGSSLATGCRKS